MTLDPVQELDDQPAQSDAPTNSQLVTATANLDDKAKTAPEALAVPKSDPALAKATRDI